jgi:DNA (cytosine-5)-methyltransferase 1
MKHNQNQTLFDLPGFEMWKPKPSTDWKWELADLDHIQKNGLKVLSCFACGGGSTMGYKLAGCEVVGCVEIDKKMNEIYIANHHPKHNYLMDIREFNNTPNDELPQELFNLDILDGSPPCTTFSMAGDREESWGKEKKFREGQALQTLDDLSFVFIDTARKLKPKVVIMENVEGLLLGSAWAYVQKIYSEFAQAGYKVHHWLLKGQKMGVPQTRQRVFFVATRNDINFYPQSLDMSFDYCPVTYGEIKTGKLTQMKPGGQYYQLLLQAKTTDKSIGDINQRVNNKVNGFQSYIIHDDSVIPTIRSKPDIIDFEAKAYISKETIIRSQTFPQDFNFINNTYSNISYVCGMSVPPIMTKRVVERLIRYREVIFGGAK